MKQRKWEESWKGLKFRIKREIKLLKMSQEVKIETKNRATLS